MSDLNRYFKTLLVLSIVLLSGLLLGCTHKNPLLNDSTVKDLRGLLMFEKDDFPIRECARFYAGVGEPNLKNTCDRFTENYYKTQMKLGEIPKEATLRDYRDAAFWKQIVAPSVGKHT